MEYLNLENIINFNITPILALVLLWTLFWKGVSLWKAAKNDHKIWFIVLFIINTCGLLEMIYFFFGEKKRKIVIGGTFDCFHKGHRALISRAVLFRGDITVGITSDEMAEKIKGRKVENYSKREERIKKEFLKFRKKIVTKQINNIYGFAINEEFDLIVVSSETKPNAIAINEKRREKGLKELKIISINLVKAKDGKPISSTRIRNGEIDEEGRIK